MHDTETLLAVIDASERRRDERRNFLRTAATASVAAGGLSLLAACSNGNGNTPSPTPTPAPTPTPTQTSSASDADILNFALNLEYLEAQFYSYAVFGTGLPANMLTGTGTQGTVTGGRAVTFADPIVQQYAREIAADEIAHVAFLQAALGAAAVAQPAINIDGGPNGAFTAAARAAGIVAATGTFDPYANDDSFLLGAFIFEDVGVTAYKGASPLINSKVFLEAAAGILAAEAYHAGLVRTTLYRRGMSTPTIITNVQAISDARDRLDGTTDLDQGITPVGAGLSGTANLVPTDANGLTFSRSAGQVLNIVYLTNAAVIGGGFFPNGTNGTIRASAAN